MIRKYDRDSLGPAIIQRQTSAQEGVVDMHYVHGLEQLLVFALVTQGQVKAGIRQRDTRAAKDTRFVILLIFVAKGEHIHLMPGAFQDTFMQVNMICYAAHVRLIRVHHHSDTHKSIVQLIGDTCQGALSFLMVESLSEE